MGLMSATDARPSHTVHAILAVASERITSAWLSVGDPTAFVVADYADFAVQEDGRATTALNLSLAVAPGVAAEDFAAEVLSPFPPACAQAFLSAVPADRFRVVLLGDDGGVDMLCPWESRDARPAQRVRWELARDGAKLLLVRTTSRTPAATAFGRSHPTG